VSWIIAHLNQFFDVLFLFWSCEAELMLLADRNQGEFESRPQTNP